MKYYKKIFKEATDKDYENELRLSSFYSEYTSQIHSTEKYDDFIKVNKRLIDLSMKKLKATMKTITDKKAQKKYFAREIQDFRIELTRVWDRMKKLKK